MARGTLGALSGATAAAAVIVLLAGVMNFPGGIVAAGPGVQEGLYSETFRSPAILLGPGDVIGEYYQVGMPRGHVALRGLDARLVDEHGRPVPVSETYLHRWVMERYYIIQGSSGTGLDSRSLLVSNAGVCQHGCLAQWFGLGSETRLANTSVPAPYGIVVGKPDSIPFGFEEAWFLVMHAIDTRGAVNARGCTECVCELYNVTTDVYGREIPVGYEGGQDCCYGETHCPVRVGFKGSKRELFLEYTVTWVNMTEDIVPARVYILDVTDSRVAFEEKPQCLLEYTVDKCPEGANKCIHTAESAAFLPEGGDVVFAVAHQHTGGLGASLRNENGVKICSSFPIYGQGSEAGNESGYIVGMSTCYPEPGTIQMRSGEKLHLTSWYNNEQRHTGAVGLFYLLVADPISSPQQADYHTKMVLGVATIIAAVTFVGITISRFQLITTGGGEYKSLPQS